jgi:CHAT domain-containing protein/tetratricopeptide (TPR) repeat protein
MLRFLLLLALHASLVFPNHVVLAQSPWNIQTIREQIDRGEFRDVLAALQSWIGTDPAATAALPLQLQMLRAEALLGAGFYEEAGQAARSALARVTSDSSPSPGVVADAWYLVARTEMQRVHRSNETKEALEQAMTHAVVLAGPDGLRALRVKDRIALEFSAAGKSSDAEQILRDNLEKVGAASERDRLRFTNTLGIALLRQSKYPEARSTFAEAYEGRARLLSQSHPESLESQHNLGVSLRRLGRSQDADKEFAAASSLRMQTLGADHPDTLTTRTMIVRQLIDKSGFAEAARQAQQIVDAMSARLGEAHPKTIEVMGDLATSEFRLGNLTQGLSTYRRAYELGVTSLGETYPETMNVGHEYAGLLYQSGKFAEALSIFEKILTATRKIYNDEHRDTLATLHSIAVILSDIGRNDEAIEAYNYVISMFDKHGFQSNPNRMSVLNNLAVSLRAAGRYQDALTAIDEVVKFRKETLGAEHSLTLLSRSNLAATLAALRRYPEALEIHRDVYSTRVRRFGQEHPDTLRSLHNMASTFDESGEKQEARQLYEQIIEARMRVLGAGHLDTLISIRAFAGLLMETGDDQEARKQYQTLTTVVEKLRSEGTLSFALRRAFLSTVAPAYKALTFLDAQLGTFEEALSSAEMTKARTLLETSAARAMARSSILTPAEEGKLFDLEFQIGRLDGQIAATADVVVRADLTSRRNAIAAELAQLNARFRSERPKYRQATEVTQATADDLPQLLTKDSAFLSFVQDDSRTLVLWATDSGQRGVLFLPEFPHLAETIEAYRMALSKTDGVDGLRYPPPGISRQLIWRLADRSFRLQTVEAGAIEGATPVRDLDEIRLALSDWIFGSLPGTVQARRTWIISPDGPLAILPFDTLTLNGKVVIEEHDVALIHSLSVLRLTQDRARAYATTDRVPMLAIGDPVYQQDANPVDVAPGVGPKRGIDTLRAANPDKTPTWPNLPGTAQELTALGRLFDLRSGSNLFQGPAASVRTVAQLRQGRELERFRFVVFATHGYLDRQNPDLSGIVLSQVQLDEMNDGYLRAAELASYEFRSDLIVISACETGLGTWVSGEGILGLPFALYVGGNNTTMMTLWPIFDGSTADFIERFFRKVQAGTPFVEALSQTKREFAGGDAGMDRVPPAVWAPFVMYGGLY